MENELNMDCARTRDFINRLVHTESLTDEETAKIILHTERCESCKTYLNEALQLILPTGNRE